MSTQIIGEQVRWQDLMVRSDFDSVLEIAKVQGWTDCEVFGHGDMIAEPQDSMGWKLIPADQYEHSIPPEAVRRLHQIVNTGIRVRGVLIADDQRRIQPASTPDPAPVPAKRGISLPSVKPLLARIGNRLHGFVRSAGAILSFSGRTLLGLLRVAGVIALMAFAVYLLIHVLWPILLVGAFLSMFASTGAGGDVEYDPKLIALVDDGNGGTVWVSLFTWYD